MLLQLPAVLDTATVEQCRVRLNAASWADGRLTAGHLTAPAKDNQQLPEDSPSARELGALVVDALYRHPSFFTAVLPRQLYPPLFNRYCGGQSFGTHVDNAVRFDRSHRSGQPQPMRTDVSITVFLSDPDSYDGGELVIEDTYGVHQVKLAAGHAVIYPGTSLHRVLPVTRGERLAAFLWVQSMVRDAGQRRLLFDLDLSIRQLTRDVPQHPALVSLTGTYHNLLRQWASM